MTKTKRGGKRPNSGRKPEGDKPKIRVTITLSADVVDLVDGMAETSRSLAIEAILINHFEEQKL